MDKLEKVIKGLECCRRGFCFACPYNDGIDENIDCKQRWADDALALLKAQQPRVMTLEEMDDLRGRGQSVYYEDREASAKCQDMFFVTDNEWNDTAWLKGEAYTLVAAMSKYGKTWRCWTSRPTDEQREEVKWDA